MEKRLRRYMEYYRRFAAGEEIVEGDFGEFQKEMCVQISFFQHERLIHLIVTVLFAVLAVVSILVNLFIQELAVLALCLMFFVLLIPYIRHYYILENGVQRLYEYYDQIRDQYGSSTKSPIRANGSAGSGHIV